MEPIMLLSEAMSEAIGSIVVWLKVLTITSAVGIGGLTCFICFLMDRVKALENSEEKRKEYLRGEYGPLIEDKD